MKKKLTITIITAFSSVILGLVIVGIGFFSGGVDRLQQISKPEQITKTYTDISSLKIDYIPQHIAIQESADNYYHVSYYNSPNHLYNSVKINQNKNTLTLSSETMRFRIKGLLHVLGEVLAQRNSTSQTINIQIPKNKTLEKLEGYNMNSISIQNSKLGEINFSGNLNLENVDILSGNISGYRIDVLHSNLKNVTISAQTNTLNMSDSILEQVKIEGYHSLEGRQLTLIGENVFTPGKQGLTVTNLDFTDKNLTTLSFNIHNKINKKDLAQELGYSYGGEENSSYETNSNFQTTLENVGIFTRDKYEKLPISSKEEEQTLITQMPNSKNKLTIQTTNATINLRTPQ